MSEVKYLDKTGLSTVWSKVKDIVTPKADKVSGATAGHLAGLNSSGNLVDSGMAYDQLGNEEDIDQDSNGQLQFANRAYNSQNPDGMGYKILRKDATFASQVTGTNTIYEIRYNFVLSANFNIPSGCVLKFVGGSIDGARLYGSNTDVIVLQSEKIFGDDIILDGTWNIPTSFPSWFGAKGDGVTDDSRAIQRAINVSSEVVLNSIYYISSGISISSNKRIYGRGKLVTDQAIKVVTVNGSNIVIDGIEIDGGEDAIHGIYCSEGQLSRIDISDCCIHGMKGTSTEQSNGIYVGSGCDCVSIRDCKIYNITAPPNGTVGDVPGSCQGILVGKVTNTTIQGCSIYEVSSGEDGDGIQVYAATVGTRYQDSFVTVDSCVLTDINKRAIKIQASNCTVTNCRIESATINNMTGIAVFGENCTVTGNYLKLISTGIGISIAAAAQYCIVSDNVVLMDIDATLTHSSSEAVQILGKSIKFVDNYVSGSFYTLRIYSSATDCYCENNTLIGLSTYNATSRVVYSSTTSIQFVGNYIKSLRAGIQAEFSRDVNVSRNVISGGYFGIILLSQNGGEISDNIFPGVSSDLLRNYSTSSKVSVSAGQLAPLNAISSVPTDGTHKAGEIYFNTAPSAGGVIGWVCISGGTPGTWKGFGTIES